MIKWMGAFLASVVSVSAFAAPGEYWDVALNPGDSSPVQTRRICLPRGGERDPRLAVVDEDCQLADVARSGRKTQWTQRCERQGLTVLGEGELRGGTDQYEARVQLHSTVLGQTVNVVQTYNGKRASGSCDAPAEAAVLDPADEAVPPKPAAADPVGAALGGAKVLKGLFGR